MPCTELQVKISLKERSWMGQTALDREKQE